ncbi:MAG TPA: helix-turn-helix domain-containing protein [Thermomicrobiaceae bacterium]|nr:helix-turn-helix domain-containing protein [Thermomicrobiaceae bacterium]
MIATTEPRLDEAARHVPASVVGAAREVLAVDYEPGRTAFAARALRALAHLLTSLDPTSLDDAAGASSDFAVLLGALERPEIVGVLRESDPLVEARLRGLHAKERLLVAEGGTLSVAEVARRLGISRQAVDKRRRAGHLLAVTLGRRGFAYPAWQLDSERGLLPGLDRVLAALAGHDPWMQFAFMLTPNVRLEGETPLAALRAGRLDTVLDAAAAYGEQGAA